MAERILVVDDTRTVRRLQEVMLRQEGYEVLAASDGEMALELIAERPPDLVLLDLMMPRMDGIECCRRIKSQPQTRGIKVVMVTSKDERAEVRKAFDAGCDGFITKPVQKEELLRQVASLLRIARARAQLKGLMK